MVSIKPELIWENCLGGLLGNESFLKNTKTMKWKQFKKNTKAFLFEVEGLYSGKLAHRTFQTQSVNKHLLSPYYVQGQHTMFPQK